MSGTNTVGTLQNRLSDKLQSSEKVEQSQGASWLGVVAHGKPLLLPLSHAGEIFPFDGAKRVPYTHQWFLGVANLRGALCGVVDLGAFITPGSEVKKTAGQMSVVALNPLLQINAALLIDRLQGLKTRRDFVRSSVPPSGSPDYFGHLYTDQAGQSWQELNLQKLALSESFLHISEVT